MFALKLLELKTARDFYLIIFLCFFIILTQFIFDQSMLLAGYLFLLTFILITLLAFHNLASPHLTGAIRLTSRLFFQAIPVMALLFLFFPRISTPLWSLPDDSSAFSGGLSPIMEPGSISRLSLSDKTAFRVTFENAIPPPSQRYWRNQVFWETTDNGRRWTLSPLNIEQNPSELAFSKEPYRYTIMLEPHQQNRLVALDLPLQSNYQGSNINSDYLLISNNNVSRTTRYSASSMAIYNTGQLSNQERSLGLQLPEKVSEKISTLVSKWKSNSNRPQQIVDQALLFFRNEPFNYTLNPPRLLGEQPVNDFLFKTRQGFCEHYATAFVYLMRVAGIPARIVAGYQGGEYNPVGKFLEVRQADAHAWSEVWLEDKGWVRIDPTGAVAPERVELGVDFRNQLSSNEVRFAFQPSGELLQLGLSIRHLLNSIDYNWQSWVLGYSFEKQIHLLARLGFTGILSELLWAMSLSSLFLLAFIAFIILRQNKSNQDEVAKLYLRYCKKLAIKGVSRHSSETASAFAQRAIKQFPNSTNEINLISKTYQRLRYEESNQPNGILFFQQLIRRFHP
jgi:transglutaminase-like putative cysteine protease